MSAPTLVVCDKYIAEHGGQFSAIELRQLLGAVRDEAFDEAARSLDEMAEDTSMLSERFAVLACAETVRQMKTSTEKRS